MTFHPIRWFNRVTGRGCVCCGTRDVMWRRGDHPFAAATVCRPCKFGACEERHE